MANFDTIKTTIDANINTNGNQAITGAVMNSVLKQMVDSTDAELTELESLVAAGYKFNGVITKDTVIGPPQSGQKLFYLAYLPGVYSNVDGRDLIQGQIGVFWHDGSQWVSDILWNASGIQELLNITPLYKTFPQTHEPFDFIYNFGITGAVAGKAYWLQVIYRSESVQQLTLFRKNENESGAEYDEFLAFKPMGQADTGIQSYSGQFETGETAFIVINWDKVPQRQSIYNYFSEYYVYNDRVFNCGLLPIDKDMSVPHLPIDSTFIKDVIVGNYDVVFDLPNILIWQNTESGHNKGDITGSEGYKSTTLINVEGIAQFVVALQSYRTTANIAYYDENENCLETINGYSYGTPQTILASSFPLGTKYVRFSSVTEPSYEEQLYVKISKIVPISKLSEQVGGLEHEANILTEKVDGITTPKDIFWAACGDSVTNANHASIYDIEEGDQYMPIDGYADLNTYKRKNYAYYFAKEKRIKWANYGYGGTCLTHTAPKAYEGQVFFPFCDERMTQLKAGIDWDYITIFFGINDVFFNPVYQRDLWLTEQYGVPLGYPMAAYQIGAEGFANAEQKAACDAATGSIGGVHYDNANDYFFAKFIGEITDTTKNTWFGAWNNVLPYLMAKYKKAKIMIVATYEASKPLMRNATKQIAEKWGVTLFDFADLPYWYGKEKENDTPFENPNDARGWVAPNGEICPNTVGGYQKARLSYDLLHPSNLGYQILSEPFGSKMLKG